VSASYVGSNLSSAYLVRCVGLANVKLLKLPMWFTLLVQTRLVVVLLFLVVVLNPQCRKGGGLKNLPVKKRNTSSLSY